MGGQKPSADPAAWQLYEDARRLISDFLGTNGETDNRQLDLVGAHLFGAKYAGSFDASKDVRLDAGTPYALINTHPPPGEHWFGIARTADNQAMIYDSFGRRGQRISKRPGVLARGGKRQLKNAELDAEQREEEDNCGQRSLAWLWVFDQLGEKAAETISSPPKRGGLRPFGQ